MECSSHGTAFDVVNRLVSSYLGSGRTLYVDNCYTIPDFFRYLKREGILACGTMWLNRRGGAPKFKLPELKKADIDIMALSNGSLNLWFFDKQEVNVPAIAHNKIITYNSKINPITSEIIISLSS
ncbi:PiggyBac transposable element-derived protein 4-like [Plakobranchus ocellatus]|uniref:PiggyBac transposable element-derived protein 4-like n=1 Tax=Plakobranchus ocellatus TaxID=259542 RepID=A0AAV4D5I5_9GAST|nr:PiggyBac transposable element-derived protein 4-like [Plakobranchus ocellatus]